MEPTWINGAQYRVKNLLTTFRCQDTGRSDKSIYFILVTRSVSDLTPYGLYIGMTGLDPEARFEQHKQGKKAARVFRGAQKRGAQMLPQLNRLVPKMSYEDALRFEALALEAFRGRGKYRPIRRLPPSRVFGG